MGKNLKGRECGKGICQRKDGKYSARYIARDGSRRENILIRCRKQEAGLLIHSMRTNTTWWWCQLM